MRLFLPRRIGSRMTWTPIRPSERPKSIRTTPTTVPRMRRLRLVSRNFSITIKTKRGTFCKTLLQGNFIICDTKRCCYVTGIIAIEQYDIFYTGNVRCYGHVSDRSRNLPHGFGHVQFTRACCYHLSTGYVNQHCSDSRQQ